MARIICTIVWIVLIASWGDMAVEHPENVGKWFAKAHAAYLVVGQ